MRCARALRVSLLLVLLVACGPADPGRRTPAQVSLSDATHGGHPGFYFLPPLAPATAPAGEFDSGLAPIVQLCPLLDSVCDPARPLLLFGANGAATAVRLVAGADHYALGLPAWEGDDATRRFRVRVLAAGLPLGHADFTPAGLLVEPPATPTIRFRIERGIVRSVSVTPAGASLSPGGMVRLEAIVLDLHGRPVPGARIQWASSAPAIAAVDPLGRAYGRAAGKAIITAAVRGVSGSATLRVSGDGRLPDGD